MCVNAQEQMCSSGMQAANLTVGQQSQLAKGNGLSQSDNHSIQGCSRQIKSKRPNVNLQTFLS
ncbi:hypothetical protein LA5095_03716 [Roseibium album]|uniref:Uncharacterized protein n=1 Tax=Roseibium album TaxID=311410 RepID=A0A0M7APQ4_9HYPH|nr:hypothetical protein LA5094_02657 [Roseibium album]CTQ76637.1 hypothetical protein LA5095_03716 [Roseibium album]CTQ77079.1 hypothetical protein LA5096_04998 [Roseibium album]